MWYIFRHGETLHNKNKIRQGRCASMLSLKGVDQVKSYAYRLLEQKEDLNKFKIITSPMVRTKETAQIICEITGLDAYYKVQEEELLAESDLGIFTNIPFKVVQEKYDKSLYEIKDIWTYRYPEGESFNEIYDRILNFIKKYKNEENLLIITHGCCFSFFKSILSGEKKEEIRAENLRPSQNYFLKYDGKTVKLI